MARTWLIALGAAFLVVEGSLDQGETFAHELLETTSVLMETSEAAVKLKWRLVPEPYVIHWAADKAQQGSRASAQPAAQAPRSDVKVFAI